MEQATICWPSCGGSGSRYSGGSWLPHAKVICGITGVVRDDQGRVPLSDSG